MVTKEIGKEIGEIKFMLEKMENMITSRLIGIEEPEEDEKKEIEDYEERKEKGKLELHEI